MGDRARVLIAAAGCLALGEAVGGAVLTGWYLTVMRRNCGGGTR